jgi:hypothetical protein
MKIFEGCAVFLQIKTNISALSVSLALFVLRFIHAGYGPQRVSLTHDLSFNTHDKGHYHAYN